MESNAIIFIPVQIIQDDIINGFTSFKHIREHDPIVIWMWLTTDDCNIKLRSQF
ncbi:hypothetical protein D3C81_1373560 [compost metagenome]